MIKEERWIPCSKQPPKENKYYLVQNEYGDMLVAKYIKKDCWKEIYSRHKLGITDKIVAWMSLPKPYNGEKMTIEEGIAYGKEQLEIFSGEHAEFIKMAIHALEMQKKLAEFSGMDICNWIEDYDEYEHEADVDDFLIDEINAEMEAEMEEK